MKLTRLFTVRIRIIWKDIIDTVIMCDQLSNAPAHLEKNGCLDIFLISNIQNIGMNRLFLLHLSFNFDICPVFICEIYFSFNCFPYSIV